LRVRCVYAKWERRQVRVRVPFDGGGKRLHFHCVPKEVNGDSLSSPLDVGVRFRHLAEHRGMGD
ncbi:MAG: hypothetical protein WBW27_15030, partial [Pseudolabrys sp.]